jgi:GABA(A) receptor-associated protein
MNFILKKIKDVKGKEKFEHSFKDKYSFERRKHDSETVLAKYPNRVPVIIERFGEDVPNIDRSKYLVPDDLSMANFMYVIRKRIKLEPEKAIYLFVNGKVLAGMETMNSIYDKHRNEDGFLYMTYSGESTFG